MSGALRGSQLCGIMLGLCGILLTASGPARAQGFQLPGGNSKGPTTINSAQLDYFDKEQKLVYSGGVVAKQGDSTLRATTVAIFLTSDPTKSGQSGPSTSGSDVRRMEAAGPVTMTSKDQVGTGDSAIYEKTENKLYLIGNVTLSQEGNVIKGLPKSRLIYDLASGHAHIEGGVTSLFVPKSSGDDSRKDEPRKPVEQRPAGGPKPESRARRP